MDCHALLQGIFLTQGSHPHLLPWQVSSLPLAAPGKPGYWQWNISKKRRNSATSGKKWRQDLPASSLFLRTFLPEKWPEDQVERATVPPLQLGPCLCHTCRQWGQRMNWKQNSSYSCVVWIKDIISATRYSRASCLVLVCVCGTASLKDMRAPIYTIG